MDEKSLKYQVGCYEVTEIEFCGNRVYLLIPIDSDSRESHGVHSWVTVDAIGACGEADYARRNAIRRMQENEGKL